MGVSTGENRRKILIIDKAYQNQFIAKFFSLVTVASVITGWIVYSFCGRTVTTVFKDSRLKIMTTADFILPGLLTSAAVVIGVVGVATALIALYMSHRIVGPVYRLRQDLARFKEGDLQQIFRLRDKDELKSLANILNETARSVQHNIAVIKEEVDQLETISAELSPKAREHVKTIRNILDQYHA
jgi:methyl-accepting chemotaxis protein